MSRNFFKKDKRVKNGFYDKVIQGCKQFKKVKNCSAGGCSECPFKINEYCLMNVLIYELGGTLEDD